MFDTVLKVVGSCGLAGSVLLVARAHTAIKPTALLAAWYWSMFALFLWSAGWILDVLLALLDPPAADQLWYAVSIVPLGSLVAVLGARKPGLWVWSGFVILPLLIVLELPAVSAWSGWVPSLRLQLETPPLIGCLLVLIMGAGNYFGTRFTGAATFLASAVVLLVIPASTAGQGIFPTPERGRLFATLLLGLAALTAARPASTGPQAGHFQRIWLDFRDWFGIVWAKRVQDRMNEAAANEQWPCRLEMHGFVALNSTSKPDDEAVCATSDRIKHTFHWILRRFAEPEWIEERLPLPQKTRPEPTAGSVKQGQADDDV